MASSKPIYGHPLNCATWQLRIDLQRAKLAAAPPQYLKVPIKNLPNGTNDVWKPTFAQRTQTTNPPTLNWAFAEGLRGFTEGTLHFFPLGWRVLKRSSVVYGQQQSLAKTGVRERETGQDAGQ